MDVCHLVNNLTGDGAQRLLLQIIKHSDPDVRYTTCAIEEHTPLAEAYRQAGSRVVTFDATSKFDVRALKRLIAFFHREDFDILHAHLPYSQIVARAAGKVGGITHVVSTQHNVPANYHPVERVFERVTRPLDSATIAVSNGVRAIFVEESFGWETSVTDWYTIYNGIDVDRFNRKVCDVNESKAKDRWNVSDDELLFLNVSRYVAAKAQTDLLRAMPNVVGSVPNARLFIVGGGQLEGRLNRVISELGLENRVTVTGRVSDQSIHELYSIADAFVFPSVREGFGLVLIEAMASNLPVIATDIPGVREVVTADTGILVPPNNPTALAKQMTKMRSAGLRQRFGKNGYRRAREQFDIERVADSHVALYKGLVEGGLLDGDPVRH